MKKQIPANITEIQEEVSLYVTEVLHALVARGMSLGEADMIDFPRLLWSMHYEEYCYDLNGGTRKQQLNQDFGHYELLGKYAPNGHEITDGPSVVLYQLALHGSTEFLLYYLHRIERGHSDFEIMFHALLGRITVLVYTHEMMHWLIHQIRSTSGESLGDLKYTTMDEIAFHESMVQMCMVYALRDNPLMISMVGALERGQPMQYKLYKELGDDFDAVFDAFQFLHESRLQSFEILKRATQFKVGAGKREREGEMWIDLLKHPENEAFAQYALPAVTEMIGESFPELAHAHRGTIGARRFGII